MPIFDDTPPPVLTLEQKKKRVSKLIRRRLLSIHKQYYTDYLAIRGLQQNNAFGLSPAEVRDALEPDLAEFIALDAKITELIALLPPSVTS